MTGLPRADWPACAHATFSELNRRIESWLRGTVLNTEGVFGEVKALFHAELSYVFPGGGVLGAEEFWSDLRGAWGSNAEIRLATPRQYFRFLFEDRELMAAEAVELQKGARAVSRARHARRTTLIFRRSEPAAWGLVVWRLHESLVPESEEVSLDWSELDERD